MGEEPPLSTEGRLNDHESGGPEYLLIKGNAHSMTDDEAVMLITQGKLPMHSLEKHMQDSYRAVEIRRQYLINKPGDGFVRAESLSKLPYKNYDWDCVSGVCCENPVGYIPVPVGIAGPLIIDGLSYPIPMATTEGALIASVSRGCKVLNLGGGVTTALLEDGMTRSPCLRFPNIKRAHAAKMWLESDTGAGVVRNAFESTSSVAKLRHIQTTTAGSTLYVRFKATTGDAMGMNMISKGVEKSLSAMVDDGGFNDMEIIALSGNCCCDKKAAAINWIEGRGKAIVAEAFIPKTEAEKVLKCSVDSLEKLNTLKNLVGSAMSGSTGGFNAHAANIVAAMFLCTGQDIAQLVESSNCITMLESSNDYLQATVTMPSIEVGTVGGGTNLGPQNAMLDILGVAGGHPKEPGYNAQRLARIIAGATLAGELSLCAALAAGHLVRAHMTHNRRKSE